MYRTRRAAQGNAGRSSGSVLHDRATSITFSGEAACHGFEHSEHSYRAVDLMVTRSVREVLQSAPRLRARVTIVWHERARESMGETPMPLSNTLSHNPLKQRAAKTRMHESIIFAIQRLRLSLELESFFAGTPQSEARIFRYRSYHVPPAFHPR